VGSWCIQISNWGIIKKFSLWIGLIFVVFIVLAAVTNYGYNHVVYTSAAPESLFIYNILIAILPYLLGAIISFVVFAFSSKELEPIADKETKPQETENSTDSKL
jgi:hypothetical protein